MVGRWIVVQSDLFAKQVKLYSRNTELIKKLEELVESFQHVDDPGRIGDRKSGQFKGVRVARLSKQNRLMYEVMYDKHEIRLLKIGDHKQVYGRG